MNMSNEHPDVKFDMNSSQSDVDYDMGDDDESRDAALAIEENILKEELDIKENIQETDFSTKTVTFSEQIDVKQESFSLDNDIILPESLTKHHITLEQHREGKKKESSKSKKELEEEEREKMHVKGVKRKRKRKTNTTREQYEIYLQFMESDHALRSGTANPIMGDNYIIKKWEDMTNALNSIGTGPNLSVDDWKKRFVDWKNSTRSKARKIQQSKITMSGGEESSLKLTDLEERCLALWGKVVVTCSPDIQVSGGLQCHSFSEKNKIICDSVDISMSELSEDMLETLSNADNISVCEKVLIDNTCENVSETFIPITNECDGAPSNETDIMSKSKKNKKNSVTLEEIAKNLSENYKKNVNLTSIIIEELKNLKQKYIDVEKKKIELEQKKLLFEIAKYKYENKDFVFDISKFSMN